MNLKLLFFKVWSFIMVLSALHGKIKEKTNKTSMPHTAQAHALWPMFWSSETVYTCIYPTPIWHTTHAWRRVHRHAPMPCTMHHERPSWPSQNAMHHPCTDAMHGPACPSTKTQIPPHQTCRHQDYMILLLLFFALNDTSTDLGTEMSSPRWWRGIDEDFDLLFIQIGGLELVLWIK